MSCRKMRWGAAALCAAVLVSSSAAWAEYDTFYLGTGRDGALTVSTEGNVINRYAQVFAPLAEGDDVIVIPAGAAASFQAGDLVMVFQTTGLVPVPDSGSNTVVSLYEPNPVGRWEFARIGAVAATQTDVTLSLRAPLFQSYAALVTQVIRIPEYTSVQIDAGGSINAAPWDGATGGVLAFLAQGTVTNDGTISAVGAGLRGGQPTIDTSGSVGCPGLDEPAPKGAQKGEGFANVRYGAEHTGLGNVGNGGGGGVCMQSGGGGGGNGGSGGKGGAANLEKEGYVRYEAGGLGGASVNMYRSVRLALGGGGGAGHGVNGVAGYGGRGGGVILVRANALEGTGNIDASGQHGGIGSGSGGDGGGGGGAGGTTYLRFATTASCGNVLTRGGAGGSASGETTYVGPGGGGGGGSIFMQSTSQTCTLVHSGGGSAGRKQDNVISWTYGATGGAAGVTELLSSGYTALSPPSITQPSTNGLTNQSRVMVAGTAQPGVTVVVYIDGVENGRVNSDSSGNYSVQVPNVVPDGTRQVQASAFLLGSWSERGAATTFTVDSTPPAAPVISSPASNSWLATRSPTISGTAEPHSEVLVLINGGTGNFDTTTTAGASGEWSLTIPVPFPEGTHVFSAKATDVAGNTGPVSSDIVVTLDVTVPETSITAKPASPSTSASATFSFSSSEEGVIFECSLDEGAFASCASPLELAVSDGSHEFQVRAKDGAGNLDATPAVHSWIVDTGAPDVSIVSGPAARTNETSATFALASNDRGASFECLVDDATIFEPCTASLSLTGLLEGEHSLQVRARDVVGNISSVSATWTWTVDTTAPEAPVVMTPSEGQVLGGSSQVFSGTAEAGSLVRVFVDGTEVGSAPSDDVGAWSVTSSTVLEGGVHSVKAVATDVAGNTSGESAARTFEVDATPPETTIVSKPEAQTESTSATFDFESEAGATFECSLDGAAFAACSDPVTFSNLSPGDHDLKVRAKDAAGNVDPTPASYSWKINQPAQGCGCSSPAGDPSLAMMLLAGLGVLVSRRRRR